MVEWRKAAAVALALATLAACGGVPAPRQELGAAKQAVSQARATEAPRFAPEVFTKAHGKLAQAQTALAKGDHARARRLADEATVDAELAQATAESARNKSTLDEMRRNIKTLKNRVYEAPAKSAEMAPDQPVSPTAASKPSQ